MGVSPVTLVALIISFVVGTVITVDFLVEIPLLSHVASLFLPWGVVVAAFACGVGVVNLVAFNYRKMKLKGKRWWLGLVSISVMFFAIAVGLIDTTSGMSYRFIYDNLLQPLGAALFAVNAFFIVSAAYRAFRVTNLESGLLMVSGFLVMLGNVPIGDAIWPGFSSIRGWIMNVPNAAGMRGIVIGSALGAIAISLRVILGLERTYLGIGD